MDYYYQPEIQEVQYVIDEQYLPQQIQTEQQTEQETEQYMTWIETWDTEYQELAKSVWEEYVADPSLLTADDYETLDDIVFNQITPTLE